MFFDTTLQVAKFEVGTAEDHVTLAILVAIALPAGDTIMPIPAGVYRWGISKEEAIARGQEMVDAGQELPDPKPKSDIVIAQSLAGVDQAVEQVERLGGKKSKK